MKEEKMPKFTYEELHESLWKYARWMSSRDGNRGHWMLNKDDLYSEYLIVMYKCYEKYASRDDMTLEKLLPICKSSMRNKFRSMLTYCFQTHRKSEKESCSLYDKNVDMTIFRDTDPSAYCSEDEVFTRIRSNLDSFDGKVLDAILGNNERVGLFLDLHRRRVDFCLDNHDVRITPHIVACALCEEEHEVENSFTRIKKVLQSYNKKELHLVISCNELVWI